MLTSSLLLIAPLRPILVPRFALPGTSLHEALKSWEVHLREAGRGRVEAEGVSIGISRRHADSQAWVGLENSHFQ